jgi:hypothetical protein
MKKRRAIATNKHPGLLILCTALLWGACGRVPRATPDVIHTAIAYSGRNIVGAGVSTCAPLQ